MEETALACAEGISISWPEALVFCIVAICVVCIIRSI